MTLPLGLSALAGDVTRELTPSDLAGLRHEIQTATASGRATGVAVALTSGDKIVWQEGFGWADVERQRRLTEHTAMSLASLTKPFTTTTLMTLVAAGQVHLDRAFGSYLECRQPDGAAYPASATIRSLGSHTSGLPTLFQMFRASESPPQPDFNTLLDHYGQLVYPPGQVYEYSNVGYAVLGAVANQILTKPFGRIMEERLLRPLGLANSYYAPATDTRNDIARRYDERRQPIPYYTTATPPSGELFASVHDVARFAICNLNEGKIGRRSILTPAYFQELHRPVFRGSAGAASTFGWFTARTKSGLRVVSKDGGQPGVSAQCYLVPEARVSCVVLTNRSDNQELVSEIANRMMSAVLPDWSAPDAVVGAAVKQLSPSDPLSGTWRGTVRGNQVTPIELTIQAGDSRLRLGVDVTLRLPEVTLRDGAIVCKVDTENGKSQAFFPGADSLQLKVIPNNGVLTGRILASSESPGNLSLLPFYVRLTRSADARKRDNVEA